MADVYKQIDIMSIYSTKIGLLRCYALASKLKTLGLSFKQMSKSLPTPETDCN